MLRACPLYHLFLSTTSHHANDRQRTHACKLKDTIGIIHTIKRIQFFMLIKLIVCYAFSVFNAPRFNI